ncbi:hypothetical protein TUM17580_39640 [Citrobacter farmeri]|nr:hypothetical protein TUM17580_39640 [Citrobacter farmeri]
MSFCMFNALLQVGNEWELNSTIKARNLWEVTCGRKKSYLSQFLLKNCVG